MGAKERIADLRRMLGRGPQERPVAPWDRVHVMDFDPAYLRQPEVMSVWSTRIFTRDAVPSRPDDHPEQVESFEAARQELLRLTRAILKDSATVKHTFKAAFGSDEGIGKEATGDNVLEITYGDGATGAIHWNPGQLAGAFPNAPLEASGRIRQVLESDFPEAQLNGPVAGASEVWHPFPETYSQPAIY